VVAVRLLNAKMLARSRPEGSEARESFGPEALEILEKRFGKPKGGVEQSPGVDRDGTVGRLSGSQARRHARLADHLAGLAPFDVDV
jgi:hypothetical protein